MADIRFGTDGWRAVIAEDFTFQNVERVSQAAADFWIHHPPEGTLKRVVIGYDRRFASDRFAAAAAAVFAANDFEVWLTPEPTPTPSISFAVRRQRAAGGVMITASHNPPNFNGYKIKSHLGAPADAELCGKIESFLNRNPARQPARTQLRNVQLKDLKPAHYAALKKLVDWNLVSTSGLRFAHEALFGVGAGCFEQLLRGTSCKVTTLDARHDVLFGGINPEPIEKNYIHSSAYLRRHPHDFCLVTDGDADRIGGMDGRGRYVSTHQLICLLLHHFAVNRQGRGRVVKALTTTSMVDKMCAELGLHLTETGVGFKYMASEMIKGGVLLAAEESGGIGFQGHIPERDGIAAGVVILEMLAWERASINELIARLIRKYGAHEYGRIDASYPVEERANLMRRLASNAPAKLGRSRVIDVKTFDGVKFIAEDTSWLMLRGSGTEPIVRIYAESSSEQAVRRLLSLGVRLMKTV